MCRSTYAAVWSRWPYTQVRREQNATAPHVIFHLILHCFNRISSVIHHTVEPHVGLRWRLLIIRQTGIVSHAKAQKATDDNGDDNILRDYFSPFPFHYWSLFHFIHNMYSDDRGDQATWSQLTRSRKLSFTITARQQLFLFICEEVSIFSRSLLSRLLKAVWYSVKISTIQAV